VNGDGLHAGEIAHASLRGAVAAAAMTGMRAFTVDAGLVDQTPPQAIARQRANGLLRRVPRGRRRAALAADHLLYGLVLSEIRARPKERPA
jgi:hypothetical protein